MTWRSTSVVGPCRRAGDLIRSVGSIDYSLFNYYFGYLKVSLCTQFLIFIFINICLILIQGVEVKIAHLHMLLHPVRFSKNHFPPNLSPFFFFPGAVFFSKKKTAHELIPNTISRVILIIYFFHFDLQILSNSKMKASCCYGAHP